MCLPILVVYNQSQHCDQPSYGPTIDKIGKVKTLIRNGESTGMNHNCGSLLDNANAMNSYRPRLMACVNL